MTSSFLWQNVAIQGGGYHQAVFPHPTVANTCATRCDIAGFFLWQSATNTWKLLGNFTNANNNDWGPSAFCWHPTNANTFWIYTGTYFGTYGKLYQSIDGGNTLTQLTGFPAIYGGSNQNLRRSASERLAVAPDNPNILLLGTFSGGSSADVGFFRSTDGGNTWSGTPIATLSGQTIPAINAGNGQTFVIFDRVLTGNCYLAIFGLGICKSTNYGASWTFIGGPYYPYKGVAVNGTLYTASLYQGDLTYNSADTNQGLAKYSGGTWTNLMTGSSPPAFNYGLDITLVDVNPNNTAEIVAGNYGYSTFWISENSGASFSPYTFNNYFPGAPYQDGKVIPYGQGITDIKYDQVTANRVWLADQFGVNKTDNWNASSPQIIGYYVGLENTEVLCIKHPPSGSPILAMFDLDGLQYPYGLSTVPQSKLGGKINFTAGNPRYNCSPGLDYSISNPLIVVRAGVIGYDSSTANHYLAQSSDGGTTWSQLSSSPAGVEKICISSTNSAYWIALNDGATAQFTLNSGSSWSTVSGLSSACTSDSYLSNPSAPIDKDRTNGNVFWVLDCVSTSSTKGQVFKLTISGTSCTATQITTTLPSVAGNYTIKTTSDGEVWVATTGLYRSTNGATFTQITQLTSVDSFCFGIPSTGSTPVLYVAGNIGGVYGIYQSLDKGTTFTLVSDNPNNTTGISLGVSCMEASPSAYGVVYLGTNGHGAYYSSPTSSTVSTGGGSSSGGQAISIVFNSVATSSNTIGLLFA